MVWLRPALTDDQSPSATLFWPPLTLESVPLAALSWPPLTLARRPLARFALPPPTADRSPLAVLPDPPLTLALRPLAVLFRSTGDTRECCGDVVRCSDDQVALAIHRSGVAEAIADLDIAAGEDGVARFFSQTVGDLVFERCQAIIQIVERCGTRNIYRELAGVAGSVLPGEFEAHVVGEDMDTGVDEGTPPCVASACRGWSAPERTMTRARPTPTPSPTTSPTITFGSSEMRIQTPWL